MSSEPRAMNRRERLRTQTLQEIRDASFEIIDADGLHALSIAALARSMGMSAPAVYRYFPSRDALVAHLTTLAYEQLLAAMSQAVAGGRRAPHTRVRLLVAAYRDWALRHPRRYGMLFGERTADLPGEAGTRTPLDQAMALLIDLLIATSGSAPAESAGGDQTLDGQLRSWARIQGRPDISPRVASAAILIWTRVHGIVSLELTGMLDDHPLDAQRLIRLEIDSALQQLAPSAN
ncbi:TetR/AcrR family transcriptional regulator [Nonomuraea sp. NPDC049158]|uniref:TetR/AcrR family transcriptional regulator n=1 Tax=Nonomuraea sp. NPDC049158 TaxID=3155649 RepID=UPI0033EBEB35